ncbi:carotenoid oxygenase family protein [Streptomyces clavuligerus]|uniref:Dioxygenase n=1 Tax=Streptomyces clavuligerus TaxID=1901 RepID=B5GMA0_STRCL|nr:carotenoid oxygenase family protein [Streptomyces clavuligerus]ANW22669.1 carotenoid oxygenase [Streptomyces clavuligerus]AXU17227.1 carotenoid oxygenase [Streptomyces clavuligerus]EDY47446.1 carotenoid oxygenase [Streptomyces clavuligerus]EFG04408.1 Carotenoid oxygenase [Streptomyces clavuligerus]MBY6307128.1 carotenoid oxygenase family protein [Streptomyces clavuligerus]
MGNEYVEGNYAPVRTEHTVTELKATGRIPEYLDGRYVRNGPNPIADVDPDAYHWFMGDGMVHGVRIRDGRAEWYRNRWVRTSRMRMAAGEISRPPNHRAGVELYGANTNVIRHAGHDLALVEGGIASYELDHELDTMGPWDFGGTLPGGYTAHPKADPVTGELHAVTHYFGQGNRVRYSVIGTDGRARRTVDIQVPGMPMMHDFSLTEKYVVLYDLPVTFDARQAARIAVPRPLRPLRPAAALVLSALVGRVRVPDPIAAMVGARMRANENLPFRWNPRHQARIGLMPREGGSSDVRWFEVEPCYVFHTLNAHDAGDTVVLDVVRHPRMFVKDLHGPNEGTAALHRWTVHPAAGKVVEARLDDRPQEFPRVDDRVVGRPHRYGYAMGALTGAIPTDAVLKHDLRAGTVTSRALGRGKEAGEFVFVPSRPDAAEDEGVLMGFVYDATTGHSDLVLLDAATLETVATVGLPVRVPHGFHGNWLATGS